MSDYYANAIKFFGKEITPSEREFYIPFKRYSREGKELLKALWTIEHRMVGPFFDSIKAEAIEGDIVEFGVYQGNSLLRIGEQCKRAGLDRQIYGFDSFEGLPAPTEADQSSWYQGKFSETTLEAVTRRLRRGKHGNVILIKGWFEDTLTRADLQEKITKIAYARIDSDLYQSAVECLAFLESRLSHGAYLTFDDWLPGEMAGECKAFFEWASAGGSRFEFEHLHTIAQGITHMRVWHRDRARNGK